MATSYNGWEASRSAADIGIVQFNPFGITPFKNGGFAGGVKGGDVHAVFTYLVDRLNGIEPIMRDPNTGQLGYGCWGYSYRANVNNPSTLSCHSSGTALDYNATRHANGTSVSAGNSGWSAADIVRVRALLRSIGGVVRWLEGNDPMHFEIHGTADEVRYAANKIRGGTLGSDPLEQGHPGPPAEPPPTAPTPIPTPDDDWLDMATKEEVARLASWQIIAVSNGVSDIGFALLCPTYGVISLQNMDELAMVDAVINGGAANTVEIAAFQGVLARGARDFPKASN